MSATMKPAQELNVDGPEDYVGDFLAVAVMVDGSGTVYYMTSDGQWEDEDGEPVAWELAYDEGSPAGIVWSEPREGASA